MWTIKLFQVNFLTNGHQNITGVASLFPRYIIIIIIWGFIPSSPVLAWKMVVEGLASISWRCPGMF